MKKKLLSVILSAALVLTSFGGLGTIGFNGTQAGPAAVSAASKFFTDIQNHWVKNYVIKAIGYGIISGYDDDNLFRPNNPVTRAEFCTMVNNAFENKLANNISFSDVEKDAWYYDAVAIGVTSGYIMGYDDGFFRPNAYISRQEAAVIGERITPYNDNIKNLRVYDDYTLVGDWAYTAVQRMLYKGYIGVYDDGKLHPTDALTRAQAVKIVVDIFEKEHFEKKDTVYKKDGQTYKNTIYTGEVTIDKAVAGGDLTFENCVFLGRLNIQGGGEKSLHFKNCRIGYAEAARTDNPVRLVAENETVFCNLLAKTEVILEENHYAGTTEGLGFEKIYADAGSTLTIKQGLYPRIKAEKGACTINLDEDASVRNLSVGAKAGGTSVTIDEDADLINAYAYAQSNFFGGGRVRNLYLFTDGVTYEKRPGHIIKDDSVSGSAISANGKLLAVLTPADGSTGISLEPKITIAFSQPVYTSDGREVTSSYLEENIFFTAKKEGGTAVEFKAEINKAGTLVTLTPKDALKKKSKFFIYFDKEVFRAQDNKELYNSKFSASFTCGDGSTDGVTWKPANGTRGQATSVKPSISFASPIAPTDPAYEELTAAYLKKCISFRKIDLSEFYDGKKDDDDIDLAEELNQADFEANGKAVTFSAEVAKKNKGITITPKTALTEGMYYLAFKDNAFKYADSGEVLTTQYIIFTVGYIIPTVTFTPKDGKTYYPTDDDIEIIFNDLMYTKDLKDIDANYIKNNVKFHDNTAGTDIAFTASVKLYSGTTKMELDPVSLLPDGHEFTVTVPTNVFMNKDKKSPVNTTTSFTTGYTSPAIDSVTAVGATSKVTVTVKANMNASGYIKIVPAGTSISKAEDIKSGGTSFSSKEGSTVDVAVSGTYTGGASYTAYAYIYTGSKTSAIKSVPVTIVRDVATANRFTITPLGGAAQNVTVGKDTTYSVTLPFGSSGFDLSFSHPADNTVVFDTNGGSSYRAADATGSGISTVSVPASAMTDLTRDKTISVKVTGPNKTDSVYKINVRVAGDTGVDSVSVTEAQGTLDSGKTFVLLGSCASAEVIISVKDPNAVITCSQLSSTTRRGGTLTGYITPQTGITTVTYTVKSNQDSQVYTFKLQKLE